MERINIAKMMVPKVFTAVLHRHNSVRKGLEVLMRYGYTAIPVLDKEERYLCSVTEGDFLRHMLSVGSADLRDFERTRISEIMREDFCPAITMDATAEEVVAAIKNQNFLPIVDGRGVFCGLLTRRSVIVYLTEGKES